MSDDQASAPRGTEAVRDRNRRVREEAAAKRRSKREGGRRAPAAQGLDASEIMDDALARGTHAATSWLKRHFNVVQWVVVVGAALGIGWQIYSHQRHKSDAKSTDALMAGLVAEDARVGEDSAEPDPMTGIEDKRPHYADDAARLAAAASAYRGAVSNGSFGVLARLGLAGVLFDQGKYKEALAEYDAVRQTSVAAEDSDVRGRTIEGSGLSEEALGHLDAASKLFRELGNFDSPGFSALGLYHLARLAKQQGDTAAAQDHLKKALEKLGKDKPSGQLPGYLERALQDLQERIDPKSAEASRKGGLTPEQIKALTEPGGQGGPGGGIDRQKLNELLRKIAQKTPAPAPSGAPASSSTP